MGQKNKKGVLLVTVLFILALAMILISSALLLTSATRSRIYSKAETSQARLTVTSAAEAFYQALQMQEITDDALETYAKGKAIIDIKMDNGIPGMRTTNDNKTTAHIYESKVENKNCICIDFTTTIGDAKENVKLVLNKGDKIAPPDLFSSQIDFNGDLDNNFRGAIGAGAPSGASDNIIVYRGNYHSNQSQGTVIDSDVLFLGKKGTNNSAYFENNEVFNGDLIFLDNYFLSFNSTNVAINGDVYFMGASGNHNSFVGNDSANRSYGKSTSTWMFINRKTNVSQTAGNVFNAISGTKNTIFLSAPDKNKWESGLSSALSGVSNYSNKLSTWSTNYNNGAANSQINKAKKFYTTDTSNLVQTYPTTQQMKNNYNMPIAVTDCNGYETTTFTKIVNTNGILPAKNYLIQGDSNTWIGHQITNNSNVSVVVLDGQKDYIFFINESITLEGVVFAVLNPSPDHHQYFILAPNKNITFNCVNSGDTNKVACGLLSIDRGWVDYQSCVNGVKNMKMADCNSQYDGIRKPTINFYAMGNNQIEIIRGTVFEGYLGQFESNYNNSNSNLKFINASNTVAFKFYGRIMATNITSTSADFKMPYCPSPNSTTIEEYAEAGSQYKVLKFLYYY